MDRDAGGMFIWISRDTTSHTRSDLQFCMQRREREVIWCGRDMDVTGAARDHQSKAAHVNSKCFMP